MRTRLLPLLRLTAVSYAGASLLSKIEIDVSDLKDEFPVEDTVKVNVSNSVDESPFDGTVDKRPSTSASVRVVKFNLVIEVNGKQLKYEARWPPEAQTAKEVRVRKSGYISLAPSFAPGTE